MKYPTVGEIRSHWLRVVPDLLAVHPSRQRFERTGTDLTITVTAAAIDRIQSKSLACCISENSNSPEFDEGEEVAAIFLIGLQCADKA